MRQQFIRDTSDTFQTYIYENNRKVVPSEAFLTAYLPEASEGFLVNAVMTIGADGLLSYPLGTQDNALSAVDYRAVIEYVSGARTYFATLFYDVVNSRLNKVITDEDLAVELPQIREAGWKVKGAAKGGSSSTIVDPDLKRFEDDYFTGGSACNCASGETRQVTGFTSETGTVTTDTFSSPVAAGDYYSLTRSFYREIQRSFEKIEERLRRIGRRSHLVLDPHDLREVHIFFSVAEVCKGLVTGSESIWWQFWKEYEKKAEDALASINFKYDSSGDGVIEGMEKTCAINQIRAGRR